MLNHDFGFSTTTVSNSMAAWSAGFGVCLSLIVSIGAQNVFVLRQALRRQHVIPCVAWCVMSDALLVALGVGGMAGIVGASPLLAKALGMGGAVFLLAYGVFSWRRAWRAMAQLPTAGDGCNDVTYAATDAPGGRQGTLRVMGLLAAITLLNPHVYLDTVLLMGSIGAQRPTGEHGPFVTGAASASLLWFSGLALAGQRMQALFANPRVWRWLDGMTGTLMFVLAWNVLHDTLNR